MDEGSPLLELDSIVKLFPGVKALDNVSLTLRRGEILGLVGENGAGKSTLVRIITGVYTRDGGTIRIKGRQVEMRSPLEARTQHKIAYISQEGMLCLDLSVAENIALGNWQASPGGIVDWKSTVESARVVLRELGLNIDPEATVRDLRPADRQLVEIARALSRDSEILLMDEPTSWLSESEKVFLFDRIRRLRARGVGIVFISHFLEEVLALCDRVQVLRDGKSVGVFESRSLTKDDLIAHMLGQKRTLKRGNGRQTIGDGKVVLKVEGLTKTGQVEDVSFELREGEILGIAGLFGSGKTELARILFGLEKPDKGRVLVAGREQKWLGPSYSINIGLGFVTEDRQKEGIVPYLSIGNNISLASLKSVAGRLLLILDLLKERRIASELIARLGIHPNEPDQKVMTLSGGNQQKVVLAKWLLTNCRVLILDEPTRGVDVGAKYEIYGLLREQTRLGQAVLFISSELAEILEIPDRYLVFKKGRIAGEFTKGQLSDERELLSVLTS